MAAAAPFAIKAGMALGSSLLGKKLSGPSKDQKTAMAGTQAAAKSVGQYATPLVQQGGQLAQAGGENLGAAGSYYRNLLGSRQQAQNAVAPEVQNAMSYYRGAENKTKRTMTGGSRDYALAELDRQKVGQIAAFTPAARRAAAEGSAQIGSSLLGAGANLTNTGVGAAGTAAQINNSLYSQAADQQKQQTEGGKQMGGFIYDILDKLPLPKFGGGGGGITMGDPGLS